MKFSCMDVQGDMITDLRCVFTDTARKRSPLGSPCSTTLGPRAVEHRAPEWMFRLQGWAPFLIAATPVWPRMIPFPSFEEFRLGEGRPGHKVLAIGLCQAGSSAVEPVQGQTKVHRPLWQALHPGMDLQSDYHQRHLYYSAPFGSLLYHYPPGACPSTVGRSPPVLNRPLPPRCHRDIYYHPPPSRNHTPLSNNNRPSLTTHGRYSARLLAVTMFPHPRRDRRFTDMVIPFP